MIKSINDIYRDKISSFNNISAALLYLTKLSERELDYILGILLSDLYKLNIYTSAIADNKNILKYFETNDSNLIKYKSKNNNLVLEDAICATTFFNDLDLINKILLMEDIENSGKEDILYNLHQFHTLDKMIYSFIYDLSFFNDLYVDFITKEKNKEKLAIDFLSVKLDDLKIINYEKYRKFILEFVKIYYKFGVYNKLDKNSYIDEIEKIPLKQVYDRVEKDDKFLFEILKNYLEYNMFDNKLKNSIDDYFDNNADDQIKKKLKIPDKRKTS